MKRRQFLKAATGFTALASLPQKSLAQGSQWLYKNTVDDSPITLADSINSVDFNGDNVDRPHNAFWNLDGYIQGKGGVPQSISEEFDVLIIGGGMSGLISAYYLKDKKIAILEMDSRLGGNAKGEKFNNSLYSIGAAYIVKPEVDSDIGQMLQNISVLNKGRVEHGDSATVLYQSKLYNGFWDGVTSNASQAQFKQIFNRLHQVLNELDFDFSGDAARELDTITFDQWLNQEFGEIHEHIREYFQLYGWSSFCASTDELSAFQYLSFICFDTDAIMAFPGGNALIAQGLTADIRQSLGNNAIRSSSTVLKVISKSDHVEVIYEDAFGALKKVISRKVIMANQKFVARRMIENLPKEHDQAISRILYRSYIVGNVILNKPIPSEGLELFTLNGQMPASPTPSRPGNRSFTDICFGSWAQNDHIQQSILTLYQGFAYDGARQFLFNPDSHEKYRQKYLNDLGPVLNGLSLSVNDIQGLRLTRFGHALPIAMKGLISSGILQQASAPIENKIYFANQDNWANPCFETAHDCAFEATESIKADL